MHANLDGSKVRELRATKLLTQVALAKQAGIRVETLCRLELGKRPAEISSITKIAEALGVEAHDIIKTDASADAVVAAEETPQA